MQIKTKKYQLDKTLYVQLGMGNVLRQQWWVWFFPVGVLALGLAVSWLFWWMLSLAILLIIGYLLFWAAQFAGVTQMEQSKMLFERFAYQIDSRQILIKLDSKRGMPIPWDKIVKVRRGKGYFMLVMSIAQFIYLPDSVFRNENELRLMEQILKRKNLIEE